MSLIKNHFTLNLIIALSFLLYSCNEDLNNLQIDKADLSGQWIEVNTKTDTLTFINIDNSRNIFLLSRGKELKDGHVLPKSGSGTYEYKFTSDDQISLKWDLSSFYGFNDYTFNLNSDLITVEDFYDPSTPGVLRTFRKIN